VRQVIAVLTAADASVAVAVIAAIASVLAARWSRQGQQQSKTKNGHSAGEILDDLRDDVALIKVWMLEHLREHEDKRP
jgi:hypothetical protein